MSGLREKVANHIVKQIEILKVLNISQKLYYFGYLSIILGLFWHLLTVKVLSSTAFLAAFSLLFSAVIYDIVRLYNKLWKTSIGKGLFLLYYAGMLKK